MQRYTNGGLNPEVAKPVSFHPPRRHSLVRRWRHSLVRRWLFHQIINYGKRLGLAKQVVQMELKLGHAPIEKASHYGRQRFSQYQPTHHDVFISTFPKSGTNWLLQIAQQIAYRGASEFKYIHHVVAWPDAPGDRGVPLNDPTPLQLSPTNLRVIKTHLATDFMPYHDQAVYLFLLRDPKEVFISNYYFICGLFRVLDYFSIDDWYKDSGGTMASHWARHTASVWSWRDRPNTLILNYREMKKNLRLAIGQVAAKMGVELTEPKLAEVLRRSSFDYMKAHESKFSPPHPPSVQPPKSALPMIIRQGQAGNPGKELSQTQLVEIDRNCQAELQRLGSDFPYATAFDMERSNDSDGFV